MATRRTLLLLQLAAVGTAAIGLFVLPALDGLPDTPCVLAALAAAFSLGAFSLRSLDGAHAAAVEARRLKTELLSNVSHELRTPLNAILGYAEILESMPELPLEKRREMVTRTLSNAITLTCAVNNLLEYSSVVAGERALRRAKVSLSELFEELEPWVGRMIEGKPVKFEWSVDPDVSSVETDRGKLRQVVLNLLANAAKFTPAGEIRLSVAPAAVGGRDGVEIAVCDTGIGMSASEQTTIFEDFRQVAGSLIRPFGGMGLGLTLARRLCELLDGTIAVESAPARGTRITLRLPRAVPAGTALCAASRTEGARTSW